MDFRQTLATSVLNNQPEIARRVRRYLPVVQLFTGLFLAFLGYAIGKDHLHLIQHGVRAPGTVVRYQPKRFHDAVRNFTSIGFMPVVQFQAGDRLVEFQDWMGSSSASALRKQVTVLYDPVNPQTAMIDRPTWNWLPWCPTLAVGLFLICVALPGILRLARDP